MIYLEQENRDGTEKGGGKEESHKPFTEEWWQIAPEVTHVKFIYKATSKHWKMQPRSFLRIEEKPVWREEWKQQDTLLHSLGKRVKRNLNEKFDPKLLNLLVSPLCKKVQISRCTRWLCAYFGFIRVLTLYHIMLLKMTVGSKMPFNVLFLSTCSLEKATTTEHNTVLLWPDPKSRYSKCRGLDCIEVAL